MTREQKTLYVIDWLASLARSAPGAVTVRLNFSEVTLVDPADAEAIVTGLSLDDRFNGLLRTNARRKFFAGFEIEPESASMMFRPESEKILSIKSLLPKPVDEVATNEGLSYSNDGAEKVVFAYKGKQKHFPAHFQWVQMLIFAIEKKKNGVKVVTNDEAWGNILELQKATPGFFKERKDREPKQKNGRTIKQSVDRHVATINKNLRSPLGLGSRKVCESVRGGFELSL